MRKRRGEKSFPLSKNSRYVPVCVCHGSSIYRVAMELESSRHRRLPHSPPRPTGPVQRGVKVRVLLLPYLRLRFMGRIELGPILAHGLAGWASWSFAPSHPRWSPHAPCCCAAAASFSVGTAVVIEACMRLPQFVLQFGMDQKKIYKKACLKSKMPTKSEHMDGVLDRLSPMLKARKSSVFASL